MLRKPVLSVLLFYRCVFIFYNTNVNLRIIVISSSSCFLWEIACDRLNQSTFQMKTENFRYYFFSLTIFWKRKKRCFVISLVSPLLIFNKCATIVTFFDYLFIFIGVTTQECIFEKLREKGQVIQVSFQFRTF